MSGVSKSPWLAMLMRTPTPGVAGGRPFGDDGADDRERHPDPKAAEDHRQGRRNLEEPRSLGGARAEAAEDLVEKRVGRADADHRGDRDREEDDERADHDPGGEPAAEPDVEQRRERQDRDRLRGDDVGREGALDEEALRQRDPDPDGDRRADDEAEDDLEQRHADVRPEDAGADGPDPSLHHDLGCRKDVFRQVADDGHELPDREEDRQADDGRRDSLHAAPTSDVSDHGRSSSAWTDASASRTSAATAAARGSAVTTTGRGRGRSTSTTRATRPGRGVMTTTRSARATASATLWVTKTTVRGRSSQRRWSSRVELLAGERVERAERLVEQQHRGIADQRPGERGALRHPTRELARPQARGRGQTDLRERGFGAVAAHVRRNAGKLHRQRDVVDDRAPRHEARLLEVEADAPVAGDRLRPADQRPSRVGSLEPGDHPQERALAAAVRPDHGGERAGTDRQVEPGQRLDLPAGRREARVDTVEQEVESGRGRVGRHRGSMTGLPSATGHRTALPPAGTTSSRRVARGARSSSPIRTVTVGPVCPGERRGSGRPHRRLAPMRFAGWLADSRADRRWGLSPRPEDDVFCCPQGAIGRPTGQPPSGASERRSRPRSQSAMTTAIPISTTM